MLFVSHLAAFCAAFSTKTHAILHQNALRLAPKHTAFCTVSPCIQPQIAPNVVQMAVLLNKYSFCRMHMLTLFCIKTNFRENRFFAASGRLVTKRALIMLNFLLKIRQNHHVVNTREWATARKTCRFATTSASGCRACCSRTTVTAARKRRSNLPLATSFQLIENAFTAQRW